MDQVLRITDWTLILWFDHQTRPDSLVLVWPSRCEFESNSKLPKLSKWRNTFLRRALKDQAKCIFFSWFQIIRVFQLVNCNIWRTKKRKNVRYLVNFHKCTKKWALNVAWKNVYFSQTLGIEKKSIKGSQSSSAPRTLDREVTAFGALTIWATEPVHTESDTHWIFKSRVKIRSTTTITRVNLEV